MSINVVVLAGNLTTEKAERERDELLAERDRP